MFRLKPHPWPARPRAKPSPLAMVNAFKILMSPMKQKIEKPAMKAMKAKPMKKKIEKPAMKAIKYVNQNDARMWVRFRAFEGLHP